MFEVYRVLLESGFVPSRPVEFHWYSAEEGGLLGSQKIAAAYAQQGVPVRSMYQVDMTGYVPPNKSPIIGVATDNVSGQLAEFVKMLVSAYCAIDAEDVQCGCDTLNLLISSDMAVRIISAGTRLASMPFLPLSHHSPIILLLFIHRMLLI